MRNREVPFQTFIRYNAPLSLVVNHIVSRSYKETISIRSRTQLQNRLIFPRRILPSAIFLYQNVLSKTSRSFKRAHIRLIAGIVRSWNPALLGNNELSLFLTLFTIF